MVTQKIIYHPDTLIMHELFEYNEDKLVAYEKYNINEKLEYRKTPSEECNFLNGLRHGLCKEWYDNGQLRVHANYLNGFRHGLE